LQRRAMSKDLAVLLVVATAAAAAACSHTEEKQVSRWLKVVSKTPIREGIITFGPSASLTLFTRSVWGWKQLAKGALGESGFVSLENDKAVLYFVDLGEEQILYEKERVPRALREMMRCGGRLTVSPRGRYIDCGECLSPRGIEVCRDMQLKRFQVSDRSVVTMPLRPLLEGHLYCPDGVTAYDERETPLLAARPAKDLVGSLPPESGQTARGQAPVPPGSLCIYRWVSLDQIDEHFAEPSIHGGCNGVSLPKAAGRPPVNPRFSKDILRPRSRE
jgi:hypothetical protein